MGNRSKCILCHNHESAVLQIGVRHAPKVEVRCCSSCGLVFLWPRPDEEELDLYYTELYRQEDGNISLPERYRNDLDEARMRVRRLLRFLQPETRLLEIGSGSGAFLDAARQYVGEVIGVEPDAASRNWTEGQMRLPMLAKMADAIAQNKKFDLIVLLHVLEHVPMPADFLCSLGQLMHPESRLVVEVPNVNDALVTLYQIPAYLRFYYQKAHLYYFSENTLKKIFEQTNYIATIEGIQRYDLGNHIHWMLTGQPGGQGYYNHVLSPSANAAYSDALIRSGHSDTLWAVAWRRT